MLDLDDLLKKVDDDVASVLIKNPDVADKAGLKAEDLPDAIGETWFRVRDVVAVFVDLQGSSKLSVGKHPASTAAVYRAAMKNVVKVLHDFEADFIQVQGDGAFGLYWGDRAIERAVCAGITARTFSERSLEPRLARKWPDAPETGFKVGVAQGDVLVKKIGTPRNPNEQEPIWAGKPVNYAAKAAQQANRGEMIATASVWIQIEDNDYLTVSCGHSGRAKSTPSTLWQDVEIEKLTHDSDEAAGKLLKTIWCEFCGADFVAAILGGATSRPEAALVGKRVQFDFGLSRFEERRNNIAKKRGIQRASRRR